MELKGKKIVIVGPAHPLRGGLATFNERFARELQLDNEVSICTFRLQYPNFLFPGQTQFSGDPKPTDLEIDICLNSVNPINWIRAGYKYKKLKPDVILFRYWMPFFGPCFGTFARIIKQNKHTKIITIADNIIPHEQRFFDKPFNAYFLKCLDGAITMSRKVLQDLDDLKFNKPHVFNPHPLYDNFGTGLRITEARSKLNLPIDAKLMLFFGFIRSYKGLDLLLESMADPRIKASKIRLIVAGEFYEDKSKYEEIIEKHQLSEQLILKTDYIPNEEVALWFSAADVVVQPYKSATQSGVTQIAYQFEKPMIVTNVGGLTEFIPDGEVGFICEPKVTEIADKILAFYALPNPAEHFKTGLKRMKAIFSWQSLKKALESIL